MSITPVPEIRPRRTRGTAAWRRLVAQTRLHPAELVLPLFVREGVSEPVPISSMPGVVQHSLDSLKARRRRGRRRRHRRRDALRRARAQDAIGSGATDPDGILNVATRVAVGRGRRRPRRADRPVPRRVHRPRALRRPRRAPAASTTTRRSTRYRAMALAQADAGLGAARPQRDDGRPGRARCATRWTRPATATPRSSATRRSTPRRSTARSATPCESLARGRPPHVPARPGEPPRGRCARRALDIAEGADIVMVKPAMPLPRRARRRRRERPRPRLGVPGVAASTR